MIKTEMILSNRSPTKKILEITNKLLKFQLSQMIFRTELCSRVPLNSGHQKLDVLKHIIPLNMCVKPTSYVRNTAFKIINLL